MRLRAVVVVSTEIVEAFALLLAVGAGCVKRCSGRTYTVGDKKADG